nr:nucleotidyltransferase domain-containing protein [Candidatus Woesearchaeota archaeon]
MLQKSSIFRTLEVFFINPTKKQYLIEISRNIGLAHTSVKKNLDKILKLGLISESIERKGTRKFPTYKANLDNKLFKKYKNIYNITSLLESNLIEFIEEKLAPKSIVVFGSYSRGEDTENSDIDLFVECKEEKLDIAKFEKKLNRKIELHFNKDFNSYSNELKNNIINGIVLNGFLEGYK